MYNASKIFSDFSLLLLLLLLIDFFFGHLLYGKIHTLAKLFSHSLFCFSFARRSLLCFSFLLFLKPLQMSCHHAHTNKSTFSAIYHLDGCVYACARIIYFCCMLAFNCYYSVCLCLRAIWATLLPSTVIIAN